MLRPLDKQETGCCGEIKKNIQREICEVCENTSSFEITTEKILAHKLFSSGQECVSARAGRSEQRRETLLHIIDKNIQKKGQTSLA